MIVRNGRGKKSLKEKNINQKEEMMKFYREEWLGEKSTSKKDAMKSERGKT